MSTAAGLAAAFAPRHRLRAAINLGNPVLARREGAGGSVAGVSVDLSRAFAERLGVAFDAVVVEQAAAAVRSVADGSADVGFFAADPARAGDISFSDAYLLIEGAYLVAEGSPLYAVEEVDRAGHRVVVGAGSAYDLHLTRALRHAEVVRAPGSQAVVDTFVAQRADVAAGVRQPLEADARRLGGLRLLPGRFMVIRQAMGVAKDRGEPAAAFLRAFVEEAKATGFVAASLARHGIEGAAVAPPSP